MQGRWRIKLCGGAYDGFVGVTALDPKPIVVAWRHLARCGGHATFDPHDPDIVLSTSESYRRARILADERTAEYEVGDGSPDGEGVEERELVGAGLGIPSGWEELGPA